MATNFGPKLVIDCTTGKQTLVEMTSEEVAQRNAEIAQAETETAARAQKEKERQEAIVRLKANPAMIDVIKALGLV